jgi:hypothetical protein
MYTYIYIYLSIYVDRWSALLAFTTRLGASPSFLFLFSIFSFFSFFLLLLFACFAPKNCCRAPTAAPLGYGRSTHEDSISTVRTVGLYGENLGEKGDTKGKTDKRRKWNRAEKVFFSPFSLFFLYTPRLFHRDFVRWLESSGGEGGKTEVGNASN